MFYNDRKDASIRVFFVIKNKLIYCTITVPFHSWNLYSFYYS